MEIDPLDHRANIARQLIKLRAKLHARKGQKHFAASCVAIQAEIDRLESLAKAHETQEAQNAAED